jgi:hypothetical protein
LQCAVRLWPRYTEIDSNVGYLGIEVDDAMEIAEKIDPPPVN